MHPGKPSAAADSFARSGKIRSQLNSLHKAPLKQNCSFPGFFLSSLTGIKGTPVYVLKFTAQKKIPHDFSIETDGELHSSLL
jgi:hypothetical protein